MNGRFLRFNDEDIERKYYEDEYLRVMSVLTYQLYLGTLVCVLLLIMAFVQSEYLLYLGSGGAAVFLPFVIIVLAKKYPYKCNWILSFNNIAWCLLISITYLWAKDDVVKACSVTNNDSSPSCSYLFVVGGGFYTLHIALLVGTNFLLNVATFIAINGVYVFTLLPPIPNLLCLIIIAPLCVGVTTFVREKNIRIYYELINKYYIWYHIANNVLPQKFIVTKSAQTSQGYQLVKANRRARKEFSINSNEELLKFISTIDLKQETQQTIPVQDETLNYGGLLDSQVSKSLGVISQFSKKSYTSRQSHAKSNAPRLVPLDLVMRREIRRQNSTDLQGPGGDLVSSHNAGTNQNPAGQQGAGINNNFGQNVNTNTFDQGAMHVRNKRRSLFQMDDPQLQSIDNPSSKQRKSRKQARRTKLEKYKGVFRTDLEEKRKFVLTLVCYSKDESFQLIMIEEDTDAQRELILDEQVSLYNSFSLNFAYIMQHDSNLLQFYLQFIRQSNQQLSKKINECVLDILHLNTNLTSRINTFIEFYNIESNKLEITPKQFSLKKFIRDIASQVDLRVKQNAAQLIISNECHADHDIIINDEKRIRHVINYLLADCIQNTPKGQIVISTSSGAAEIGDGGDTVLSGTIKITIRDNGPRKYQQLKNADYFFQSTNLGRIVKNKARSNINSYFQQRVNQNNIHYSIRLSFYSGMLLYILGYQDIEVSVCKQILKKIGPQGNIFYYSEDRNVNRVSFYIYTDIIQDGENIDASNVKTLLEEKDEVKKIVEEEDINMEFQEQIQNSDDDESYHSNNINNAKSPAQELQAGTNHIQHQGSSSDKYGISQQQLIQQLQSGQQVSQLQPQTQNNSSSAILNSNLPSSAHSVLNSYTVHAQTLPDRKAIEYRQQQSLRKSTSQLFDESDKINDENPISDIYLKELSQTSVRFKRDLTRRMSSKPNLFKTSIDDQEYHSRLGSLQRAFPTTSQNPYTAQKIPSTLNSISKSLVNNTIILLSIISFTTAIFPISLCLD